MATGIMTEQEIDRLEELLAADTFKGEAMSLDTLQGFLCAVISGPDLIPPSTWLPDVFGDSPEFRDQNEAQEITALVMKFYNGLVASLSERQDFDLILYNLDEKSEDLDFCSWCDGYIYGSQIGKNNWFEAAGEDAEELSEMLEIFFLLNGMLKEDALQHSEPWLSEKEENRRMADARRTFPSTISAIYDFWQQKRSPQHPWKREEPKTGRNDPCPCGSGKKFKQCCGKEPTVH